MININLLKIKIFLKENLTAVLGIFLAVVLAAGLAIYWFSAEKQAGVEKETAKTQEEIKDEILKSLTVPEGSESKISPEEEKKIIKGLSAPYSSAPKKDEDVLKSLSAPSK